MSENLRGIHRANEEGLLIWGNEGSEKLGPPDRHSHLKEKGGGLTETNTRPLSPTAGKILKRMLQESLGEEINILEIGPGAGNAVIDMREITKESEGKVKIDIVNLTPINPYDNSRKTPEAIAAVSKSQVMQALSEKPFIDHQYIGAFPEDFQSGEMNIEYHLIYANRSIFNSDEPPFEEVDNVLDDKGVVFVTPKFCDYRMSENWSKCKEYFLRNGLTVFFSTLWDESDGDFLIIAKNESELCKKLRESAKMEDKVIGEIDGLRI